jgi:hypothetical protein
VYRSLENPRPSRVIAALWPRQRPPSRAAAEFQNHLRAAAKSFAADK